jgi:hypothetical protein
MALFKKEDEKGIETKEEKKEEKELIWQVGEVATQTTPIIINKITGEQLDIYLALASIKNDLEYIKSFLKE